jgi:putative ABC transport system substrate-binding protein
MRRREFVTLIGGTVVAWPFAARAQQKGPTHLVGVLAQDPQPGLLETFRDELGNLGYAEGSSISIQVPNAGGMSDRLPALANELLGLGANVIVAINTPAAKAAKNATKSVPIVIMRVADPVKSGLIDSLAHPGGNVTGLSFMPDELGAKAIEVFREVLPGMSRIGCLYSGDNPGALVEVAAVESRAEQLGVQTLRLPVVNPKDYRNAFDTAASARIEALFVQDDGALTAQRTQILELAAKYSLPVAANYRDFAEAGALLAYGPRLSVVYRRAAYYVDRLLKGKAPSDLPVEQPDKFDLFVNMKTAKAFGLTVPLSVLLRADELIE